MVVRRSVKKREAVAETQEQQAELVGVKRLVDLIGVERPADELWVHYAASTTKGVVTTHVDKVSVVGRSLLIKHGFKQSMRRHDEVVFVYKLSDVPGTVVVLPDLISEEHEEVFTLTNNDKIELEEAILGFVYANAYDRGLQDGDQIRITVEGLVQVETPPAQEPAAAPEPETGDDLAATDAQAQG